MNRLLLTLALACGLAAGRTKADDEKPAGKPPEKAEKKPDPAKAPDWSGYATYGDPVAGEIVKANESGLTLRISWVGPKTNKYGALVRGRGRTISLKENHEDFDLKYADGGLVRWKKLPPKTGVDGKKATYTEKEMEMLRLPIGIPGYAADRSDLQPGHLVELHLVRPKSVPASKVTNDDLVVKYVMIFGQAATPPTPDRKDATKAIKKN